MSKTQPIPVIDLFAGPGGLGEGFSAFEEDGQPLFRSALSIEKEPSAHETLRLRAFFRLFRRKDVPGNYYRLLRGEITLQDLYDAHPRQAERADAEAWHAELGEAPVGEVRRRIAEALNDAYPWVLLGGPPCQPFSLAGRSRNRTGTQYSGTNENRHQLYVEYLQIIADFWPAVFVMENVRGLLSAKFDGERIFDGIARDLRDPAAAVVLIPGRGRRRTREKYTYRLYPLTRQGSNGLFGGQEHLHDYLVRCEHHGIPQARHRVILIGLRDDIAVRPELLSEQKEVPARCVLAGLPRLRSGLSRKDDAATWRTCIRSGLQESWFRNVKEIDQKIRRLVEVSVHGLVNSDHDRGAAFIPGSVHAGHASDWYLADRRLGGVCNHHTRAHMPSDLHRYLFAACFAQVRGRSPGLADFPADLLPDHNNVARALNGGHFADRFCVQVADRPSTTVVSHIAKDGHYYIHPDPTQCRSLTVREAARLQTFPDDYFFVGNRTQQYTQVGNAVPPACGCIVVRRSWRYGKAA